jgi:tetratricopeptide (TPR) repeat protein
MNPEPSVQGQRTAAPSEAKAEDRAVGHIWALLGVAAATLGLLTWLGSLWLRPAQNPDAVWEAGEASLRAGRIDQAQTALHRLSKLRRPTPKDLMLRAQVDLAHDRIDQALAELNRILDGQPVAAPARLLAGQVELRRHRARIAEQHFREAIRLDSGLVAAHREMIYILGYQLRRAELSAEFQALAEVSDLTFDNVFHWCLMRTALWEPGTAVDELTLFIQADPDDRWSRLALAENFRRMGRLDDAEGAIAPLPASDPAALAIRVMLALDRHQDDKAEELLRSGRGDDPYLARLRGRLALARRDAATAVRCFREARAGLPEDRDALFGLISALTMQGDEKSAAPLRERINRIELLGTLVHRASAPGARQNVKLLRELGAACASLSRDGEARAWYKLAIARDPLDAEAQQALFQISERNKLTPAAPRRAQETPRG